LNDRAADAWSSLLAIANLAGGEWPERARKATIELAGNQSTQTLREMLLDDLRELFDTEPKPDVRFTKEILAELHKDETRPCVGWRNGKPITDRQLATQLKPFGIKPKTFRDGSKTRKGYELAQFDDAFARYLPVRSETPEQTSVSAGFEPFPSETSDSDVSDGKPKKPERFCGLFQCFGCEAPISARRR
jgi:hypothetical protein